MIGRPRSVTGEVTSWGLLQSFRNRALVFGVPLALCAVLSAFPERHRAVATLAPTDPASLGLGGTLGQLGASNTVFGNQAAIEIAMKVGSSQDVRGLVIKQIGLDRRLGKSVLETHRWLAKRIDIRSLRGGIIQIDFVSRDQDLAEDIVKAYTVSIRERLSAISRQQTQYKRTILEKLARDASDGLSDAQSRYDEYRLRNRDAVPEVQTATVATRIGSLEGAIRAKRITLSIARQMYTDENFKVQEIKAELAALERELNQAKATNPSSEQTIGSVVASTRVLYRLQRELGLQRALYDNYMRFLQGTSVEDLTSTANMRILEPPHIDTERQFWLPAIAAGLAIALFWAAVEFYRLRPPVGASLGHHTGRRVRGQPTDEVAVDV